MRLEWRYTAMRDGIRRSVNAHRGEQDAVADLKRLDQIAAMCDAAKRGGIAVRRALTEIIEIARGDADTVVRVGHEVRPDIQTGETR
jgi:hypothetical protein